MMVESVAKHRQKRTKVLLLDLAHTTTVDTSSMIVPLGLGYLKAYLVREFGDLVDVRIFKHPERALAYAASEKPDIIGLANYVWNRQLNLKIGQYLHSKFPDALFVAGGPNIDIDPDRQAQFLRKFDFLDFVIMNSGELPFTQLVRWWRDGARDESKLPPNLVWLERGQLRTTPLMPAKKHDDDVPSPYLNGALDEFLEMGMIPLLETNRGCPFSCTFCAWGMSAQDVVRQFSIDTVIKEIEYVGERANAVYWIVCDANFGMLKRDPDIARAIRAIKDRKGLPHKCHVWLAKNATERNLEIGSILGDMVVPVMAVQSLDDEVLKNIKRDNISLDTYVAYQKKFHQMGMVTYSDVIIPLPGETLRGHIEGIERLLSMGVARIQNHNLWILPGSELNSPETWSKFGFRTRRRLIHGDAGRYRAPNGDEIEVFEYEESVRQTTTISEEDMFYLRKYHFLLDFCWSQNVYKPLLKFCVDNGIKAFDVFDRLINIGDHSLILDEGVRRDMLRFWAQFDEASHTEWFDTDEDIESYFADSQNFERLLNQGFEKLHIFFSVVILRDFKHAFDRAVSDIISGLLPAEREFIGGFTKVVSLSFPALDWSESESVVELSEPVLNNSWIGMSNGPIGSEAAEIRFRGTEERERVKKAIFESKGKTLSKVLNTSNLTFRQLRLVIDTGYGLGQEFHDHFRAWQ
jgi:radical SAM superfamily enzyme YgiQ (UPF0313 family)